MESKTKRKMTDEERKLAEDNINLVYFFMYKQLGKTPIVRAYWDEVQMVCYELLCESAMWWDKDRGASLSNYALNLMRKKVWRYLDKVVKKKYGVEDESLEKVVCEGNASDNDKKLDELLENKRALGEDEIIFERDVLERILGELNERDRIVTLRRMDRYKWIEIVEELIERGYIKAKYEENGKLSYKATERIWKKNVLRAFVKVYGRGSEMGGMGEMIIERGKERNRERSRKN